MIGTTLVLLRAIHIVGGSFWFGAMVLVGAFLLPSVRAAGPAGGQVMRHLVQARRLPVFMTTAMLATVLSGGVLMWWASGSFSAAWFGTRDGLLITAGAVATLAVAVMGQLINVPTVARIGQLTATPVAAAGPPAPDQVARIQALQLRLLRASQLEAALLGLATALMAVARFV